MIGGRRNSTTEKELPLRLEDSISPIKTRVIQEGSTRLFVPDLPGPVKYPSFFNPGGRYVRDVSIVCYRTFATEGYHQHEKLSFADSLSGTGARGLRVAKELPDFYYKVFLNDVSPTSLDLARRSARENDIEKGCSFSLEEACAFLVGRKQNDGERFDVVDVDPFGTPSPFVDCALRSVRHQGLLSISATDTAVLCGVYPHVALRKYLGLPIRTDYAHEVGMRLIFGLLAMTSMRLESSIRPVFCHHDMHYFRAYCSVEIGNNFSRQNEKEIGFVLHCFKCSHRLIKTREGFESELGNLEPRCPDCKAVMKIAGPLWIGKIQSKEFVSKCSEFSDLPIFQPESDEPLYYDLSVLTDSMQIRTPKIVDVMRELVSAGRSATRTRLNPKAVRTDAPLPELRSVLARLSR